MATEPQQQLVVRSGCPETTTCVLTLDSIVNTEATVVCEGGTYTIATGDWVPIGTDNAGVVAQACFTANITVTTPSTFTKYAYVATQGSYSTEGSFSNKPGINADFALYAISCDFYGYDPAGFYPFIKAYAQSGNLPVIGIVRHGDLGYIDTMPVNDTGYTGLVKTNTYPWLSSSPVFDYSLGYMMTLGMLGGNTWGRDSDRVWCHQNLNSIPQWDDHEFQQNQRGTGGGYVAGKTAYSAFWKPLQPIAANNNIQATDTTSNHWGYSVGALKIVAVDGITSAGGAGTTRLGNGQITDVLNALNTSEPFKWMSCDFGIRYLGLATGQERDQLSGAQEPLHVQYPVEFQKIFTYDTSSSSAAGLPSSVCNNPKTNGFQGVFVLTNHDFHVQIAQHNKAAAYAGNVAENFYMFTHGSNNRAGSPYVDDTLRSEIVAGIAGPGYTYNEIDVKYMQPDRVPNPRAMGMRLEVYGSRSPKEFHVIQFDGAGNETYHGRWLERHGNDVFPVTWEAPTVSVISRDI